MPIFQQMSADQGKSFERRFRNQLGELNRVTEEAVMFLEEAGLGAKAVYVAHLVIEEMATNILKYGYDDDGVHEILLRLQVEPSAIWLVLEDDGHEFNPLKVPEPDVHVPVEQRDPGGLGIHLVRKMAAQIDYERCGERNRLTVSIAP